MRTRTAADIAAELEAELEQYPDERGQILVEAAQAWRQAGDDDRAIALLTQAIALGGEDGGNARVDLAQVLFDLSRAEQAHAQLDELRQKRPSSPDGWRDPSASPPVRFAQAQARPASADGTGLSA